MVQALVNNLDIINNNNITAPSADANPITLKNFKNDNENIQGTIGSLKESQSDVIQEFRNYLEDAIQEIAEENSLDLSLDKETSLEQVAAIDSAIQSFINTNEIKIQENETEINENSINTVSDNILSNESSENITDNIIKSIELTNSNIKDIKNNSENKEVKLGDILDEEVIEELNIESIEAESSEFGSGSNDIMQNQTAEEQGIKASINTNENFETVINTNSEQKEISATNTISKGQNVTQSAAPDKILEQITKQMEGLHSGSRVNIVLNPEALGKVSIQLLNGKEGLSAQFLVATQEAREILMKGLEGLKEALSAHGVNVDNVSIKFNETQESEYNSDWTEQDSSNGGYKRQNPQHQKNKEDFEQMLSFAEENG